MNPFTSTKNQDFPHFLGQPPPPPSSSPPPTTRRPDYGGGSPQTDHDVMSATGYSRLSHLDMVNSMVEAGQQSDLEILPLPQSMTMTTALFSQAPTMNTALFSQTPTTNTALFSRTPPNSSSLFFQPLLPFGQTPLLQGQGHLLPPPPSISMLSSSNDDEERFGLRPVATTSFLPPTVERMLSGWHNSTITDLSSASAPHGSVNVRSLVNPQMSANKDGSNPATSGDNVGKRTKKRVRNKNPLPRPVGNPDQWKRNVRKRCKAYGEEYVNRSGKVVPKRMVGPVCQDVCRWKCFTIPTHEREKVFKEFWALGDLTKHRRFLVNHAEKVNPARSRCEALRHRENTYRYFLDLSGQRRRVCQRFFLNTLDIKVVTVYGAFRKLNSQGVIEEDKRGKKKQKEGERDSQGGVDKTTKKNKCSRKSSSGLNKAGHSADDGDDTAANDIDETSTTDCPPPPQPPIAFSPQQSDQQSSNLVWTSLQSHPPNSQDGPPKSFNTREGPPNSFDSQEGSQTAASIPVVGAAKRGWSSTFENYVTRHRHTIVKSDIPEPNSSSFPLVHFLKPNEASVAEPLSGNESYNDDDNNYSVGSFQDDPASDSSHHSTSPSTSLELEGISELVGIPICCDTEDCSHCIGEVEEVEEVVSDNDSLLPSDDEELLRLLLSEDTEPVSVRSQIEKKKGEFSSSSSKKRVRNKNPLPRQVGNPDQWIRNVRKRCKAYGEEYVNRSGKVVRKRVVGPTCYDTCRWKCFTTPTHEREKVFKDFWALGDLKDQRVFIVNHAEQVTPARSRCEAVRRRKLTYRYFLDFSGQRQRVCKMFFVNTLDITEVIVYGAFKKINSQGFLEPDWRGKRRERKQEEGVVVSSDGVGENAPQRRESVGIGPAHNSGQFTTNNSSSVQDMNTDSSLPPIAVPTQAQPGLSSNPIGHTTTCRLPDHLPPSGSSSVQEDIKTSKSKVQKERKTGAKRKKHPKPMSALSGRWDEMSEVEDTTDESSSSEPSLGISSDGQETMSEDSDCDVELSCLTVTFESSDGPQKDHNIDDSMGVGSPMPRKESSGFVGISAGGDTDTGHDDDVDYIMTDDGNDDVDDDDDGDLPLSGEESDFGSTPVNAKKGKIRTRAAAIKDDKKKTKKKNSTRCSKITPKKLEQQKKISEAKKQKACGEEYVNGSGKVVPKREMGPVCQEKCRWKCFTIPNEEREKVFKDFWALGDLEKQGVFIASHVEKVLTAFNRRYTCSRRENTFIYRLDFYGERKQVCKKFFLNTLGISERTKNVAFEQIDANSNSQGGLELERKGRGKRGNQKQRITTITSSVEGNIINDDNDNEESFPPLTTHSNYPMFTTADIHHCLQPYNYNDNDTAVVYPVSTVSCAEQSSSDTTQQLMNNNDNNLNIADIQIHADSGGQDPNDIDVQFQPPISVFEEESNTLVCTIKCEIEESSEMMGNGGGQHIVNQMMASSSYSKEDPLSPPPPRRPPEEDDNRPYLPCSSSRNGGGRGMADGKRKPLTQSPKKWNSGGGCGVLGGRPLERTRKKACGEEYVTRTGKVVPKRELGPACREKCRWKCFTIPTQEREKLFKDFWALGDLTEQRRFIINHAEKVLKAFHRRYASSRRENTFIYHLEFSGERKRVCKPFFLNTLAIGEATVYYAFEKINSLGILEGEMRGKGKHRNQSHDASNYSYYDADKDFSSSCSSSFVHKDFSDTIQIPGRKGASTSQPPCIHNADDDDDDDDEDVSGVVVNEGASTSQPPCIHNADDDDDDDEDVSGVVVNEGASTSQPPCIHNADDDDDDEDVSGVVVNEGASTSQPPCIRNADGDDEDDDDDDDDEDVSGVVVNEGASKSQINSTLPSDTSLGSVSYFGGSSSLPRVNVEVCRLEATAGFGRCTRSQSQTGTVDNIHNHTARGQDCTINSNSNSIHPTTVSSAHEQHHNLHSSTLSVYEEGEEGTALGLHTTIKREMDSDFTIIVIERQDVSDNGACSSGRGGGGSSWCEAEEDGEEGMESQSQYQCANQGEQKNKRKAKIYRNTDGWKSNIRKRLRAYGEEYVNAKGKVMPKRELGPVCPDTCRLKCFTIPTEEREKIFKDFWALGDMAEQRKFVVSHAEKVPPARRRGLKPEPTRENTFIFYLDVCGEMRRRVCKVFYVNTLSIGQQFIYGAFLKLGNNSNDNSRDGVLQLDNDYIITERQDLLDRGASGSGRGGSLLCEADEEGAEGMESQSQSQCPSQGKNKKRKRTRILNRDGWKKNIQKRLRAFGEEYVGRYGKGKVVPKRELGPVCPDTCRLKCFTIPTEEREKIFKDFWALGDMAEQRKFVVSHAEKVPPARRRGLKRKPDPTRENTFIYYLDVCGEMRRRVCKVFYVNTLSIGQHFIYGAFLKLGNSSSRKSCSNSRGGALDSEESGRDLDLLGKQSHRDLYPCMDGEFKIEIE